MLSLNFYSDFWRKHKVVVLSVFLFGLVFCIFSPALKGDFLFYDENDEIRFEPHVNTGLTWENISWAFTSLKHSNWYPVNWLSHMLDCEIFGMDAWGHHLTSILIHASNTVLVLIVLYLLTGFVWRSLIVALLFGIHPMRVESVAWICERKDVLSLFFWLLATLAYWRYARAIRNGETKPFRFYWLTFLFFVMGLMSKAMLVTFPFFLLLLDYWPLNLWNSRSKTRLLSEKIPFLAMSVVCSWLVCQAQQLGNLAGEGGTLSLYDKIGNSAISYARYVGKFFFLENYSVFIPRPDHWPVLAVLFSLCFIIVMTVMSVKSRRTMPYLMLGWCWFLVVLLPVIGLIGINGGDRSIAIRYTYIPMIGFVFALVWMIAEKIHHQKHRVTALSAVLVFLCFCAIRTRSEITHFKNDISVWSHTVAVTKGENNWQAHYCLGTVLGNHVGDDAALKEFQKSVSLNPNNPEAQLSLGATLEHKYRLDEALICFEKALSLKPNWESAEFYCGVIWQAKGNLMKASSYFHKAFTNGYDTMRCNTCLDQIIMAQTQSKESLEILKNDFAANPDRFEAQNNLAWLLATSPDETVRNGEEAIKLAKRACELTSYRATVCVGTLSAAYAEAGDFDAAIKTSELACSMAEKSGDQNILQKNRQLLDSFQNRMPYYELPQK